MGAFPVASIRETIRETHQALEAAGIPDARLEAEVMVMSVMRMTRQNIFAEQESEVPAHRGPGIGRNRGPAT